MLREEKGRSVREGGGGFGRCYVAAWCQGSCEAWQRGVCSHPHFPCCCWRKGWGRVRGWDEWKDSRRRGCGDIRQGQFTHLSLFGGNRKLNVWLGFRKKKRCTKSTVSSSCHYMCSSLKWLALQTFFTPVLNKARWSVLLGPYTAADHIWWLAKVRCSPRCCDPGERLEVACKVIVSPCNHMMLAILHAICDLQTNTNLVSQK